MLGFVKRLCGSKTSTQELMRSKVETSRMLDAKCCEVGTDEVGTARMLAA
jgi:hypothetical protein